MTSSQSTASPQLTAAAQSCALAPGAALSAQPDAAVQAAGGGAGGQRMCGGRRAYVCGQQLLAGQADGGCGEAQKLLPLR